MIWIFLVNSHSSCRAKLWSNQVDGNSAQEHSRIPVRFVPMLNAEWVVECNVMETFP